MEAYQGPVFNYVLRMLAGDRALAREAHFFLVADRLEGVNGVQTELLHEPLFAKVLHAILHEDAASCTKSMAHAI